MYRLLLLMLVLSLGVATGFGRAAREGSNIEILSVDLAGRQTNLTRDPAWDVNPAVARDGQIAFFTNRIGGGLDVMDAKGGHVRLVTASGGIEVAEDQEWSQASWAPKGDRIAFDGLYTARPSPPCPQHCAGWHLLTVGVDGSGLTEPTAGRGAALRFALGTGTAASAAPRLVGCPSITWFLLGLAEATKPRTL
jgi:dipeptidyl aminopeptidase/acylaminoacyl peptidase